MREAMVTGIGFEHRRPCLLHLEEEWVLLVPAQHQRDPAPGSHAADPDDLVRSIDVAVAVYEVADVGVHAAAVLLDQALQQRLQVDLDALLLRELCERNDRGGSLMMRRESPSRRVSLPSARRLFLRSALATVRSSCLPRFAAM